MKKSQYRFIAFLIFLSACVKEEVNDCYDTTCLENEICINGNCVEQEAEKRAYNSQFVNSQLVPTKIVLSNFVIKRFPLRNFNGATWDNSSAPDLFIQIVQDITIIWSNPMSFQNTTTMPLRVRINPPLEFSPP